MDTLDVRIFCEMGFKYHPPNSAADRRPSFLTVAKSLGVDVRTVKARVARFEEDGFVVRYQLLPNYNALGLSCSTYAFRFDDPARKKEAEQKAKTVPEVSQVMEMVNTLLATVLFKEPEGLRSAVERLTELCRGDEVIKAYDTNMPFVASRLNSTDWRIMKSLRNDALKPSEEIARELGVTRRAVNYRLERLVESRAFFVVPMLDMRKVTNIIFYTLVFFVDESLDRGEVVDRITKAFGEKSFYRIVNSTGVIVFGMFGHGIGEPEANYRKAAELRGVSRAILEYTLGIYDCPAVIDDAIEEKIAESKKRRPDPVS